METSRFDFEHVVFVDQAYGMEATDWIMLESSSARIARRSWCAPVVKQYWNVSPQLLRKDQE